MTETKTTDATILASRTWTGSMGGTGRTLLVERGGEYFLLKDHYCGESQLRGGALRLFLWNVPGSRLEDVRELIDHGDEPMDPARPDLGTNTRYLHEVLLADLWSGVEVRPDSWAAKL